jgi:hypothetical protein
LDGRLQEALDQALAEQRLVAVIAAGARSNWRAAAWLLERQYPERWGRDRAKGLTAETGGEDDPFREVDELAEARRRRRELRPFRP